MNRTIQRGNYLQLPELHDDEQNGVIGKKLRRNSISMPNLAVGDFNAEADSPKAAPSLFKRIKLYVLYRLWFMSTRTSFDGVRFAAVGFPAVRVIMWSILFILSLAAMIWSIYVITNLYLARETFFS